MEELTIEEMTALKGGQESATALVSAANNTASAANTAANVASTGIGNVSQKVKQEAEANAGNIEAFISQFV
jgi:hypothetical protein